MPLTRQQKEQTIAEVEQAVSNATATVVVSYNGVTVEQLESLRSNLFAENARVRVVPKRLLRIVMEKASLELDPTTIDGQVAVVWGDDAVSPAKVVHTFSQENEAMQIVSGTLDGILLSQEQVLALAKLPSRQEVLGQLVGTLAGPIRGFQTVLTGVQRNFVYALSAIAEEKS